MRVAMPAMSAPSDPDPFVRFGEVVQHLAFLLVVYDRAQRNTNLQILAVLAMLIAAETVLSAPGAKDMVETEFEQGILVRIAKQVDAAAVTAIAPARTAARNKLFAAKGNATMPAITRVNGNLRFVDEH